MPRRAIDAGRADGRGRRRPARRRRRVHAAGRAAARREAEERRRVLPVIEALAGARAACRSPSTPTRRRSPTPRSRRGASIVNDVSGLRYEPELAAVVAKHGAPIVLMHTRGRSQRHVPAGGLLTMSWTRCSTSCARAWRLPPAPASPKERILVDPGPRVRQGGAAQLTRCWRGSTSSASSGGPSLVGPSRKTFLTRPLGARRAAAGARLGDGCGGDRRGPLRARTSCASMRCARWLAGRPRRRRDSEVSSRSVTERD